MAPDSDKPKITALKFKGGVQAGRVDKKKKKKKTKTALEPTNPANPAGGVSDDKTGDNKPGSDKDEKSRSRSPTPPLHQTEAEKRHEEMQRRRMLDKLARGEGLETHREKVEKFNQALSRQPEHNDMPKIGPG